MKRGVVPAAVLLATILLVVGVSAQQNNIPPPDPNCTPLGRAHLDGQHYPTSIEPEFSVWCYQQPAAMPATRASGVNDWVDTFDNDAPSITHFNDHNMGYRVFDVFYGPPNSFARGYFINVDHWMIDLADVSPYRLSGGVLVSPDRQFSFENGKLVVEADLAGGSDAMGGANRFYEIDVSPARQPTFGVDSLYGYGSFGGIGAVGCRIERNDRGGNFVCAMYDNSGRATDGRCADPQGCAGGHDGPSGRKWETQGVGTARTAASVVGGYPQWRIPGTNMRLGDVWRTCADNELDLHCRDRFRLEMTKDSIHLFVNGYAAMLIDGLYAVNPAEGWDNRLPDFWFQQGVRPYFTSWINGGQHTPTRWHWDRVAVNPHDGSGNFAAPSASPSFCLGMPHNTCADPHPNASPPTATPTPRAMPTPTPPPSGVGAQTLTFDDLTRPNRTLRGEYPHGVLDWGTADWYLSGPFGEFSTLSIGFNGPGPTSAPITFLVPGRLVRLDAFNGGRVASTVTVTCQGLPTVSQTLAPRQLATIDTGWRSACGSITVGSTNGWDTNFDNLVITST